MFCSTIIPTVNRPSLSRTVNSVLQQDFPKDQFEVIVVNDSGKPLTEADWQQSPQVRVIETNRRNRCVARNAGAAIAMGQYLHFLDDDDWMMPGAFTALWELSLHSRAAWLYGGFQFVDNSGTALRNVFLNETGNCLIQLMSGEYLPIQASFIMAGPFFSVGGFADLPSLAGGYEDIDLYAPNKPPFRIGIHTSGCRLHPQGGRIFHRRLHQPRRPKSPVERKGIELSGIVFPPTLCNPHNQTGHPILAWPHCLPIPCLFATQLLQRTPHFYSVQPWSVFTDSFSSRWKQPVQARFLARHSRLLSVPFV